MHVLLEGQVLGRCQRHTRGGDALDGGVVGQVGKDDGTVDCAGAAELVDEELALLEGDADGGEHDGEVLVGAEHSGLTGYLRGQRGVRQAGAGEYGQLLAADQGVQAVDSGDAGLYKLGGVSAGSGVHRQAVYVAVGVGQYLGAAVDGLAHAVEYAAEHVLADAQLQRVAEEAHLGLREVDALRRLEQLHNGGVAVDLEDLAAADFTAGQLQLAELVVGDALDLLYDHQRVGDLGYSLVFAYHSSSPLSAISAASAFISSIMAS